ncbi:MAG: DUF1351 domain-containing protein [Clostridium sp.]|nr:DUF1351 domain-containing protein [Clostridiales bacterium]MDU3109522.1 DUF1351 domain-containing protein [Clostridium sp.]
MNELTFNVAQTPAVIAANFEEVEKMLKDKLSQYDGAVFTIETKDIAKKELASLRKERKAADDSRKEVKAIYMKPYDAFEQKVKELLQLYDKPINAIDLQLKEFETNRIAQKRLEIHAAYDELAVGYEEYLPIENIYGPKWDNAGTTMKSIREEITQLVNHAKLSIQTISSMNSDAVEEALRLFKTNGNLAEAIAYINKFEAQKAEILKKEEEKRKQEEECRRAYEIERIRAEERRRYEEENKIRKQAVEEVKKEISSIDEKKAEPLTCKESIKVVYTISATPDEIKEVEMAFNSLGIYFERKDI